MRSNSRCMCWNRGTACPASATNRGVSGQGISILATRLPPTFWCSTRTATRSQAPWVNRPEAAASRPAAFKPRDRRSTSRSNVAFREDGSSPPTPIRQPTLRDGGPEDGQGHSLHHPTADGDHPTEQLAFHGRWIYWSQGSTTNSGVVG